MKLLCLPDFECMFMTQKSFFSILVFRSRFGPLIIVFEPDRLVNQLCWPRSFGNFTTK